MDSMLNQMENYLNNLSEYRLKIEGVPKLLNYYPLKRFVMYYYADFTNNNQAYKYFDIMLENAKQSDYEIQFAQLELLIKDEYAIDINEEYKIIANWIFKYDY